MREHETRLRNDLPYFAEHLLKLRKKSGAIEPFVFNAAQLKLHEAIEKQKAETGRVRVVVLKARQLGISTYIAARLFHRTVSNPGLRTVIVGHEQRASSNLFQIVRRFYDNLPEYIRPTAGKSNASELSLIGSTAGTLSAWPQRTGPGDRQPLRCYMRLR